jgi:hypothetical protein
MIEEKIDVNVQNFVARKFTTTNKEETKRKANNTKECLILLTVIFSLNYLMDELQCGWLITKFGGGEEKGKQSLIESLTGVRSYSPHFNQLIFRINEPLRMGANP